MRALDSIYPYRLEMGYRFTQKPLDNLYKFWSEHLRHSIERDEQIVNLAAVEYTKVLLPYLDANHIITPRFLTRHPDTHEPKFVVVHAKIARGAFAHWLITRRIQDTSDIPEFKQLGYNYSNELSSKNEPVFICDVFDGIGLNVRLT